MQKAFAAMTVLLPTTLAWHALGAQGDSARRDSSGSAVSGGRSALPLAASMPARVRSYRLVGETPGADSTGTTAYRYVANRRDSVEVSVSPYDAATVLRTAKDTIALVGSDYDVARDTLRQLASQYGVKLNIRVARDDADIAGRTYHGYVLSFNFVETSSPYRAGCDAAFLKSRALRTKTFCYQQTYALPDRLVRIRAAVPPGETVADADLSFFARNLVAAMVREH